MIHKISYIKGFVIKKKYGHDATNIGDEVIEYAAVEDLFSLFEDEIFHILACHPRL
uniref:Uncharacterized protein n=1 Tax=Helianthus annuus TaxID=4232 RepID=A0A251V1Q8_HELAN